MINSVTTPNPTPETLRMAAHIAKKIAFEIEGVEKAGDLEMDLGFYERYIIPILAQALTEIVQVVREAALEEAAVIADMNQGREGTAIRALKSSTVSRTLAADTSELSKAENSSMVGSEHPQPCEATPRVDTSISKIQERR